MEKVLELLDQIEDIDENPYHKTRTIIFDRDDMAFIKEAREELEALQFNCREWYQKGCLDGFKEALQQSKSCERYLCDCLVKYDNGKIDTDVEPSVTTLKIVERIKFLERFDHNVYIKKEQ